MKKIEAKIVADSIDGRGNRIASFILTYPRFIHSELMTHRMFSRNSASSRAIPFEKMVKMVEEDPFIPIAWQKPHLGMQGVDYFTRAYDIAERQTAWSIAKDEAVKNAKAIYKLDVTKQLCNRLLEPFMWHTVLVTATEFENFFELRCPKYTLNPNHFDKPFRSKKDLLLADPGSKINIDLEGDSWLRANNESQAEIHIQALAESMWDSYNESTPKKLEAKEWHIPFGDRIEVKSILDIATKEEVNHITEGNLAKTQGKVGSKIRKIRIELLKDKYAHKIATARCARLSYMTHDGEIDYQKDIELHDKLLKYKHMSPFEHCAKVMTDEEYNDFFKGKVDGNTTYYLNKGMRVKDSGWCNNFRGFIPYRYLVENKL